MSREVARWDKISFLEAVRETFGEEFEDVSEKFIDRLDDIYAIMWSPIGPEKIPQFTARHKLATNYPFLQYGAENQYIWLRAHLVNRRDPFRNNQELFFNYFAGLYDPNDANDKNIKVQLATLQNQEQFDLFMQKLSGFKEFVESVSKGEHAAMQSNSTD